MRFLIYILFLILGCSFTVYSNSNYEKSSSFEGLHFYIGFIENEFYVIDPSRGKELKIFIATKKQSNVKVKFPGDNYEDYSLPPDEVLVLEIPATAESNKSEVTTNKLVEISSDVPVTVYAFSSQPRTSDSYSAIPISNWGNEYYVMAFPNDQYTLDKPPANKQDSIRLLTPRSSQFLIKSAYDNTNITITPKALTRGGMQVDMDYEISLDKGECYLVQSFPVPAGSGDLTGTKIISDKPIGVVSGHQRASVPIGLNPQYDTKDHLVEMITPAESWGKSYISVPFDISPEGDLIRVMGKEPGTVVSVINNNVDIQYNLDNDIFMREFRGLDKPVLWNANKPIQLAQFMMRTNTVDRNDLFDPSMVMLSPNEQFVSRVVFHTPGNVFNNPDQYVEHQITVIAEKEALPHLLFNNQLLDTISDISKNRIYQSDYYYTRIKLQTGTHKLESEFGRFSGVLFGNGKYDSYAMILGASLTNPDYEDSLAPIVDYNIDCYQINATAKDDENISASGIYYAFVRDNLTYNFNWEIEPVNPNDTEINFSAMPEDIFQDAFIAMEIHDRSGNIRNFEYKHNAVKLEIPDEFNYSAIDWKDSVCFDYQIKNLGLDPILLKRVELISDDRVSLHKEIDLPENLEFEDVFNFSICINPEGDSTIISGQINIVFDCGIEYSFPLYVGFSAPSITVHDIDYGDVLVYDEVCRNLSILNDGNEPITIESLDVSGDSEHFDFDDSILPYSIPANDSLVIEVCFSPQAIGDYEINIVYNNSFNLPGQSNLKGTGIAPNIESLLIELGDVRVGSTVNEELILENSGNADAVISFQSFITQSANDNISEMLEDIDDIEINSGQSYNRTFSFTPEKTGLYIQRAEYITDWESHKQLFIEINANGTIPEIDIQNIDFGDVKLYDNISNDYSVVISAGNEELFIEDAFIISRNSDDIDIDLSIFDDRTLQVGESIEIPVTFNPQTLGLHEIVIGINNDSYPNFEIATDTLHIVGNAVPEFNPNLSVEKLHNEFNYCKPDIISVSITNDGSFPLDITDIELFADNSTNYSLESDMPDFAYTIQPDETIGFDINAWTERDNLIQFGLIIETSGVIYDTVNFTIEPKAEKLILNNINNLEVVPGEKFMLTLSGEFPHLAVQEDFFEMIIEVPSNYWNLIDNNYQMQISGDNNLTIPLQIEREYEKINIVSESEFEVTENMNWSITLEILPLLEKNENTDIPVNVYFTSCYMSDVKNFISKIIGVCAFDLRITEINSNFIEAKISPNPVSDFLKIELFVKKEQKINISLFDMSGRCIKLEEDVLVKNGKNDFELNVGNISSGTYMLSLQNENMIKNLIIVVNK